MPARGGWSCWATRAATISVRSDWRSWRVTKFLRRCSSRTAACARLSCGVYCPIRLNERSMPKYKISPDDFAQLYDGFNAPVSRFDCGRKCAPLNGGEPVCCSTQNAVPVVHKVEFELLKTRTDLWTKFKPYDYSTREIVAELTSDCTAIACKGARHCERDQRTIACRGFPFFPYITREREF